MMIDLGMGQFAAVVNRCTAGALLLVAAAAVSGCGSSASTAVAGPDEPPQRGGTVTFGMDQQPQCLNRIIVCGGMAATSMVADAMLDSALIIDDDEYKPHMLLEVPSTENGLVKELPGGGMEVTGHLDPRAAWSDGQPITCDDVKYRWQIQMDEGTSVTSTVGWEQIERVDCPDEQTVVWRFSAPYAPFLGIVGAQPLPKHVLEGKDFNTFFNAEIPVSSGPFVFDHWDRSVEIVLRRNPDYWAATDDDEPYIDKLRYTFIPDTNTLKVQLRTGEVDVINPPPDSTLQDELKSFPRSDFQSEPGVYWEHFAFNTGRAPLNDKRVRQAIAYSIDRSQITETVMRGQVDQLDSTILPAQGEYHEPAWARYTPDADKVAQLLEEAGYERSGAYWEKDGKPLTVLFKSTAGNNLRVKVAQLLQQLLRTNGIKMDIEMEMPEVFFGQSTIQGTYDIALWAWSSSVDPAQKSLFHCDVIPTEGNDYSGQNNYRYCNKTASDLMTRAEITPDVDERVRLTREIQKIMADDVPLLPIFQRPETMAYSKRVGGIATNPLSGSVVWNSPTWWVAAQ